MLEGELPVDLQSLLQAVAERGGVDAMLLGEGWQTIHRSTAPHQWRHSLSFVLHRRAITHLLVRALVAVVDRRDFGFSRYRPSVPSIRQTANCLSFHYYTE